jgi:hypothetical protein
VVGAVHGTRGSEDRGGGRWFRRSGPVGGGRLLWARPNWNSAVSYLIDFFQTNSNLNWSKSCVPEHEIFRVKYGYEVN